MNKRQARRIRSGILAAKHDLRRWPWSTFHSVFRVETSIGIKAYQRTVEQFAAWYYLTE